jgi:hypothetical protein
MGKSDFVEVAKVILLSIEQEDPVPRTLLELNFCDKTAKPAWNPQQRLQVALRAKNQSNDG